MKKLNKILFAITFGIFVAGIASASLGEYWSTVSHIIPRTDSTVDIGSNAKKVKAIWTDAFYGDYWISGTGNSMNVQPTGDTDDFFSFKTPAHRPTIKREGGKFIYIESTNIYDAGIAIRDGDTHSGTFAFEKDTNRMSLSAKDSPLIMKLNSDYDDYLLFQTTSNVPEMTIVGAADLKINAGGANSLLLNHAGGNVGIGDATPAALLTVGDGDDFQVSSTGVVTFAGTGDIDLPANSVDEADLKSVNAPTDEYVLTYEATTGDFEWQIDQTGAGGSAIVFDIGDDGGNDSVDVNEIATTGDTNSIFSEPTADKILIAVGNNWPTADTATTASALVANPTDCGANQFAQSIVANGNLTCSAIGDADVPNDITIDLATLASTVTNATFTTALTVDTGTVGLTGNVANNSVLTLGAGASSLSGANTGDQDLSGYWDADGDIAADEISESKIAFSTACGAGNHYYLNGNDLACEADDAGLTNLTDFDQTAWRLFYSNNLGDVIELSLGTNGEYLQSQGGTSSLTWSTPTNTTYTGGTGITLTGTVFSTTDSEIVHDNLSGFVANEHLDWTADLGAVNINAANYTDTNTTYLGGTNLTLAGTTFNVDDAFLLNTGDTATGDYNFDAGTLFIDATANEVGIGTAAPAARLHVNYPASGNVIFQAGTGDGGADMDLKYGYNGYGWYNRYLGSGSGVGNEWQLWSEGYGGAAKQTYGVDQDGNIKFHGTLALLTGTTVNDIDITVADSDNALITSGGVFDGLALQDACSEITGCVVGAITGNETITLSGDVTGSGTTALTVTVGADKILESHLKSVNAATDEYCLTYEATTGDFEWQTCGGSLAINDITDITIDTPADNEVLAYNNGTSTWLNQTPAEAGLQGVLTNSAGLLGALSDETGTGLSVFSTSPTFTTGITVPADSISHTELSEGDAFVFTGSVALPQGAAPTVDAAGETAVDTTSDQLVYYGSAKRVLQEEDTKCFSLENLAAADDNYEFYMANDAITITAVGLHCAGTCTTGADISLEDRAGNAMTHTVPTHSTGSGNTTFQAVTAANTLVAGEGLRFDVDNAVSPETDTYLICFKMKYTSD